MAEKFTANPENDEQWSIHALNIQGIFFQRWCTSTLLSVRPWELVATEYPVEFPLSNGLVQGKESRLDIWARIDREITCSIS